MAHPGVDVHKCFCPTIECTKEEKVIKEGRIRTEKEDIEEFFGSSLFHVGRCGWYAVKQSQIRRRRRMNRVLNPKRRMKNIGDDNCDTAS